MLSRSGSKYRPVYFVVQYVLVHLFGPHYPLYLWSNVALSAVIAFCIFLLARWLARGNYLIGLGAAAKIDWLEIRWPAPSKRVDRFTSVPIDRYITITEGGAIE